jgi:hypothetical protein
MSYNINFPFTTPGNYIYDSDDIEVTGGKATLKLQQDDVDFTEDFADDTDFTYDSGKAEFSGGQVQQKLIDISGLSFTEDFADDMGFVYDSDKAEFSGGKVQQKSIINASSGANFNIDINLEDWSGGIKTGTSIGGAGITGNKLDLTGETIKYVEYNADLNADMQQTGCFRFTLTTNYSAAPASVKEFISISKAAGDNANSIKLYQSSTLLFIQVQDSASGTIISSANAWSPVAGTPYEIEFNWDITSGASRLFINGSQNGATHTGTGTRDSNIGLLRIGTDPSGTLKSDFYIDNLVFFDTVQHTANYTPSGENVPDYKYVTSKVELPTMTYSGTQIGSFVNATSTESGTPKYILDDKYWSGAAWVTSDGSYSQANTLNEVNTNISSLTPIGVSLNVDAVFDNSNTISSIDELTINYIGNVYQETSVILPEMQHVGDGTIRAFNSFSTSESGSPRYTLQIGRSGDYLYWDGNSWETSDGTYDQANDSTNFNLNVDDLPVDGEEYGQFKIIFPDSNIQSAVSEITANLNVDIGYVTTNPTIQANTYVRTDLLENYVETKTVTGDDQIKGILKKNGTWYYHDGDDWVESDETYSQSNTEAEILANISDFTIIPTNIYFRWFLHSEDGSTRPYLDNVLVSYSFAGIYPTLVTITYYGWLRDLLAIITNETMKVRASWTIGDKTIITGDWVTIDIDSTGYWDVEFVIEDVDPTYLEWWIGKKLYRTNFINEGDGTEVKFSELTVIWETQW